MARRCCWPSKSVLDTPSVSAMYPSRPTIRVGFSAGESKLPSAVTLARISATGANCAHLTVSTKTPSVCVSATCSATSSQLSSSFPRPRNERVSRPLACTKSGVHITLRSTAVYPRATSPPYAHSRHVLSGSNINSRTKFTMLCSAQYKL